MDRLTSLLAGPRARGAFVLRGSFAPTWSLRVEDEAPLTLVAALAGSAWFASDDGTSARLAAPDVALLRGPLPYTMADSPQRHVMAVIGPDQHCRAPDGGASKMMGPQGVRSWGNAPCGPNQLLVGTYRSASEVSRRVLAALPPVLVVPAPAPTLLQLLVTEAASDAPGQDAMLDRLLDLLLIATLRARFSDEAPGWYAGHDDPVVGRALDLMHEQPAAAWTVGLLATTCGASRAAFARRFHDLVGESPMAYLSDWRLGLAADLLAGTDATLDAVAKQVGYANAFALSTAFKRVRGVSPREYRRAAASATLHSALG